MSGFLCILSIKTVELGASRKAKQEAKMLELRTELGLDRAGDDHTQGLVLPGGGIRVFNPAAADIGLSHVDTCIALFHG
jgi:hypothetical protein